MEGRRFRRVGRGERGSGRHRRVQGDVQDGEGFQPAPAARLRQELRHDQAGDRGLPGIRAVGAGHAVARHAREALGEDQGGNRFGDSGDGSGVYLWRGDRDGRKRQGGRDRGGLRRRRQGIRHRDGAREDARRVGGYRPGGEGVQGDWHVRDSNRGRTRADAGRPDRHDAGHVVQPVQGAVRGRDRDVGEDPAHGQRRARGVAGGAEVVAVPRAHLWLEGHHGPAAARGQTLRRGRPPVAKDPGRRRGGTRRDRRVQQEGAAGAFQGIKQGSGRRSEGPGGVSGDETPRVFQVFLPVKRRAPADSVADEERARGAAPPSQVLRGHPLAGFRKRPEDHRHELSGGGEGPVLGAHVPQGPCRDLAGRGAAYHDSIVPTEHRRLIGRLPGAEARGVGQMLARDDRPRRGVHLLDVRGRDGDQSGEAGPLVRQEHLAAQRSHRPRAR
mmetsp:Transcript_10933/g.49314  ORF Transcript_10933/g.49314 Transcript_10933/m.49314 type:complete len:443 (+) Transcript_10933:2030-3358(+)